MQAAGGAAYTPVVVPFFFNFSLYAQTYGSSLVVAVVPTSDSALPPLLSGMEVFEITRTPKEGYVYRGEPRGKEGRRARGGGEVEGRLGEGGKDQGVGRGLCSVCALSHLKSVPAVAAT